MRIQSRSAGNDTPSTRRFTRERLAELQEKQRLKIQARKSKERHDASIHERALVDLYPGQGIKAQPLLTGSEDEASREAEIARFSRWIAANDRGETSRELDEYRDRVLAQSISYAGSPRKS